MNLLPLNIFTDIGQAVSDWFLDIGDSFYNTLIAENRWMMFAKGLGNTLVIALFATLIGIVIGTLVAIIRVYCAQTGRLKPLNWLLSLYITIFRGTPVVVQLMIMYYAIFASVTNGVPVAILAFGINSGAYVAETVRSGIMAVDKGQTEAGQSLGLGSAAVMRLIVLPQAIKNILPALGNEFIALLKETSVVGYITIVDVTRVADLIRSRTYDQFFPLLVVAVIYLVLVIGITQLLKIAERRLAKSDRR
ncbi:MAG: amino acid ABC transporter permease [Clostridiales bacterium]|nr:amino acid ABC transporter permease [Clostridiales bacterium]